MGESNSNNIANDISWLQIILNTAVGMYRYFRTCMQVFVGTVVIHLYGSQSYGGGTTSHNPIVHQY